MRGDGGKGARRGRPNSRDRGGPARSPAAPRGSGALRAAPGAGTDPKPALNPSRGPLSDPPLPPHCRAPPPPPFFLPPPPSQALVAVLNFNAYLYEVLEAEEAALEVGGGNRLRSFIVWLG